MLLLHNRSEEDSKIPQYASFDEEMAAHTSFSNFVESNGKMNYGLALQDAPTARTLRPAANGEIVISDGPFADVKEQIGGFYIVEAESLDEAVEIARRCPIYAGIEVRPVMEFS